MVKRLIFPLIFLCWFGNLASSQVIFIPIPGLVKTGIAEHGFLPGKKFAYYPTIEKHDLSRLKVRVELYDDRSSASLTRVSCSDVEFTNTSEFAEPSAIYMVKKYLDTLFEQAGAIVDSAATDTVQVRLQGLDARLIGFGSIRAHGLCQMKMKYHNLDKAYCIDITDKDKHSPVGKNALVTRKTATRIIASAAVREIIEQFFVDMESIN